MRFNKDDIKRADAALVKYGIVKDGCFNKSYKGAVSSFGAAVVMSGLSAALKFHTREQSNISVDTSLILNVFKAVLQVKEIDKCNEKDFERAVIATKLALKFYAEKESGTGDREKKRRITVPDNLEVKDEKNIFNESQSKWKTLEDFLKEETVANLGWYFGRRYYKSDINYIEGISGNVKVKVDRGQGGYKFTESLSSMQYIRMNNSICAYELCKGNCDDLIFNEFKDQGRYIHFELKTTYPGALIGSGLVHGVGDEHEIKIGFQFDYVSGLPYIPGSSVKGILRSMFGKADYIKEKLNLNNITDEELKLLISNIFGGDSEKNPLSGNVLFFDAVIVHNGSDNPRIIGNDFITPHKYALKEPEPIQFFKVLPNVNFRFSFLINQSIAIGGKTFDISNIGNIFKSILLDTGIGAKTNIGYGRLDEIKNSK